MKSISTDMVAYYTARAGEYEKIYERPERQEDLLRLKGKLRELLRGRRVLEVACGTGYWTQIIADAVECVVASDVAEEMLQLARRKTYPPGKVTLIHDDAFDILASGDFTAGFAGFWWSHVPRSRLPAFLSAFHRKLRPNARVVFCDNTFVPDSSRPIIRTDAEGNSYQLRALAGGGKYEVVKNYPELSEIQELLKGQARNISFERLTYYWVLHYELGE